MMPHSYSGLICPHPRLPDMLEVSHAVIHNAVDGKRTTYRHITTVPNDASPEEIARAFGEVARLSLLAAIEDA